MKPLINVHTFLLLLFAFVLSGCQTTVMTKEDQKIAYSFQPDKEKATIYVINNPTHTFMANGAVVFSVESAQANDKESILSTAIIAPKGTFSRTLLDEGKYIVSTTQSRGTTYDRITNKRIHQKLSKGKVYYFLLSYKPSAISLGYAKTTILDQITQVEAIDVIERDNLQLKASNAITAKATSLEFD